MSTFTLAVDILKLRQTGYDISFWITDNSTVLYKNRRRIIKCHDTLLCTELVHFIVFIQALVKSDIGIDPISLIITIWTRNNCTYCTQYYAK